MTYIQYIPLLLHADVFEQGGESRRCCCLFARISQSAVANMFGCILVLHLSHWYRQNRITIYLSKIFIFFSFIFSSVLETYFGLCWKLIIKNSYIAKCANCISLHSHHDDLQWKSLCILVRALAIDPSARTWRNKSWLDEVQVASFPIIFFLSSLFYHTAHKLSGYFLRSFSSSCTVKPQKIRSVYLKKKKDR